MRPSARTAIRAAVPVVVPAAVVLVGAVTLIAYSVNQWRSMQVPSWDLAIFSELAKAYAHFQAPIVPIKGEGFNLLGDHFHPILVLLGPVWRLFPTPLALLVVQDVLLAVSAWPITRLAMRTLTSWAGGALGLFYVLSWGFQGAVSAQFHEIAFAVPMLAWASTAFAERRWRACALWCAPLVLVKEDLGLTILMAGLAIALRGLQERREDRAAPTTLLGLGLTLYGLFAFLITVLLILPALSPSGAWEYGIGGNAADGTAAAQASAGLLARLFSPQIKLVTLGVLACTAGLIGLASPWMALVLPTLAWRFLSAKEFYWDWANWHYNAILMPIAVGALLDVLTRLRTDREGKTLTWPDTPVLARGIAIIGVAVPLVLAVRTADDLPLLRTSEPIWRTGASRAAAAQQVIDTVEAGTTVKTDLGLLAYLVPKTTVYWVGTSSADTDYVIIDSYFWGGNPPRDAAAWATGQSETGAVYELVLDTGGYQVAKRVR